MTLVFIVMLFYISSQRDCFDVLYGFKLKDLLLLFHQLEDLKGQKKKFKKFKL